MMSNTAANVKLKGVLVATTKFSELITALKTATKKNDFRTVLSIWGEYQTQLMQSNTPVAELDIIFRQNKNMINCARVSR